MRLSARRLPHALTAALVLSVLAAFGPVLSNGFTGYDDPGYVTENLHLRGGLTLDGVRWAFTSFHMGHWHPLTWLSHMLDWQLWGVNPAGHHLTSLVLHALTTALLFSWLTRWTRAPWRSALASALFALHPLRVEVVAWAADRKDALSALLALLTLWAHGRYAERPGRSRYALVLVLFALGLLAKATLVTLPVLLLLVDAWPLRRHQEHEGRPAVPWRRLLVEKVPLLALSALSAAVALVAPVQAKAMESLSALSLDARLGTAALGYVGYLAKTLWPSGLVPFYPLPVEPLPLTTSLAVALALLGLVALALRRWRTQPHLFVGACWFLVTVLPVSGLMQAGMQSMADRYTYLSSVGLLMAAVWSLPHPSGRSGRAVLAGLAVAVLAVLATLSWAQVRRWEDSETLFSYVREVSPGNPVAESVLSVVREDQGRLEEAEAHAREAQRAWPAHAVFNANLGRLLLAQGRAAEAVPYLELALRRESDVALTQRSLARALEALGHADEAVRRLRAWVDRKPDDVAMRMELGLMLARAGQTEAALAQFREAQRLGPGLAMAHFNAGIALARLGRFAEALPALDEALRLAPDLEDARVARERVREDLARSVP